MLSRAETGLIASLRRRKVREAEGLLLAEGVRVVEELVAASVPVRLAVLADGFGRASARERSLAEELSRGARVERVPEHELARLAPTTSPQGVLVVAQIPRAELTAVMPPERSVVLALDAVQDPGNLGTLARTAAAFGVEILALLPGTVDAWNPKAIRAAAGVLFGLTVVDADWRTLSGWLREQGFAIYGTAAEGRPVASLDRRPREALVVGNEGAGLSPDVAAGADAVVAVPMRGGVDSLNVAVAAGILLYQLTGM